MGPPTERRCQVSVEMGPPIEGRCQVSNRYHKTQPPKFINFRPAEVECRPKWSQTVLLLLLFWILNRCFSKLPCSLEHCRSWFVVSSQWFNAAATTTLLADTRILTFFPIRKMFIASISKSAAGPKICSSHWGLWWGHGQYCFYASWNRQLGFGRWGVIGIGIWAGWYLS